jgi:hypothetical protein
MIFAQKMNVNAQGSVIPSLITGPVIETMYMEDNITQSSNIYLPLLVTYQSSDPATVDFVAIEKRLWDIEETGGSINNGSVYCGDKHELHVIVLDRQDNRLNGIEVQSLYGKKESFITGDNEWEDGQVIFNLHGSIDDEEQAVKIDETADGHKVTSDIVSGITTQSPRIPHEDLIAARYCTGKENCDNFNRAAGCWGSHSWTVTFKQT